MDRDMNKLEFAEAVCIIIQEIIGDQYKVRYADLLKNNNIRKIGIDILFPNEVIAPLLYIEDYYESYINGCDLLDIAYQILKQYTEQEGRSAIHHIVLENQMDIAGMISDTDKLKDRIRSHVTIRLVNREKNSKLLETIPHRSWLDMAVIYLIILISDDKEMGSIRVTHELLKRIGMEVEELHQLAMRNTPVLLPETLRNMGEVLKAGLKDQFDIPDLIDMDNILDAMLTERSLENEMYVLSNKNGTNGASVIYYDGILERVSDYFQTGFFILPSSIHECIIVPERKISFSPEALKKMVKEVNAEQVQEEEILSNNVYYYSSSEKKISIS
ncbi:MAG: hypothetical protein K0S76_755 [Herbinix sp.]|jgi:hypothetical protein|nr:hypothetical protein [Herbinix sp.]